MWWADCAHAVASCVTGEELQTDMLLKSPGQPSGEGLSRLCFTWGNKAQRGYGRLSRVRKMEVGRNHTLCRQLLLQYGSEG